MNSENINPLDQSVPNTNPEQFNNQMQGGDLNSNPTNEYQPTNQPKGNKKGMKIIMSVLAVLVVSIVSVFAFQQLVLNQNDPVTILKESTLATFKRASEGNFKTDILIGVTQSVASNPNSNMEIQLPMKIAVGKYIDGQLSNLSFQVGNIDLAPFFLSLGAPAEMLQSTNNNLNLEFIANDEGIFARINSFPEALKMFIPLPDKFLNEWIYAESESAIDTASMFSGLDVESYVSVMGDENAGENKEKLEYSIDRFMAAVFDEAEAEIKLSSSMNSYNINYQVSLAEFAKAMNSAGKDVSEKYPEFAFTPQSEDMAGTLNIEFSVNKKDKVMTSSNCSVSTSVEGTDTKLNMTMTNDFESEVEIEIPEKNLKIEDLMKELFSPMMAAGLAS